MCLKTLILRQRCSTSYIGLVGLKCLGGCREAMYRGGAELQDGLDLRGAVYWVRHLRQGTGDLWAPVNHAGFQPCLPAFASLPTCLSVPHIALLGERGSRCENAHACAREREREGEGGEEGERKGWWGHAATLVSCLALTVIDPLHILLRKLFVTCGSLKHLEGVKFKVYTVKFTL